MFVQLYPTLQNPLCQMFALARGAASFPETTDLSEIDPNKKACIAVEEGNPKSLQLICHIGMGSFQACMIGPQVYLIDPV